MSGTAPAADESRRGTVGRLDADEVAAFAEGRIARLACLGENGPRHLEPTLDEPRRLFRLEPVNFKTWQGNDWAERYK